MPSNPVQAVTPDRSTTPLAEIQSLSIRRRPRQRSRTRSPSPSERAVRQRAPVPPAQPARPLFTSLGCNTLVAAFDALQDYCIQQGFTVVSRARSLSNTKGEAGAVRRVDYRCQHGRVHTGTGQGIRNTASRRLDCPYQAKVVLRKRQGNQWFAEETNNTHNHDLDVANLAGNVVYRQWIRRHHKNAVTVSIERLSGIARMTARQIAHYLSGTLEDEPTADDAAAIQQVDRDNLISELRGLRIPITAKEVLNIQQRIRHTKYGPYTSTKMFIDLLDEHKDRHGIEHFVEYGEGGRVTRAFWTFDWCIEMWKKNPHVLLFDNTYKVNRFNLPLLNIAGVDALGHNFNVGFGLSSGESQADFEWQLNCLKKLQEDHEISSPDVIISDFDRGFKKAAIATYPDVPHQLCVWHVMKNINHHINKKWVQPGGAEPVPDAALLNPPPTARDLDGNGPDPPSYRGPAAAAEDDEPDEHLDDDPEEEDPDEANDAAAATNLTQQPDDGQGAREAVDEPPAEATAPRNREIPVFNPARRFYPDSHEGFQKAWRQVVYADDEGCFKRAWQLMVNEFRRQTPLLSYLYRYYLPWINEFGNHVVSKYRNYGIRATSRIESAHRAIKRLLKNRLSSLDQLYTVIQSACRAQRQEYKTRCATARQEMLPKYKKVGMFEDLVLKVAPYALKLLWFQYRYAYNDWLRDPAQNPDLGCKKEFTAQYGLPCKHFILKLLQMNPPLALLKEDVDTHWWLAGSMTEAEQQGHAIQDPIALPGRRRKAAVPDPDLTDYIRGVTGRDLMNPEVHEPRELEGNQALPAQPTASRAAPAATAPVDRDRWDNGRIPSHDEDGAPRRATLRDVRGGAPTVRARGRQARRSRGGGRGGGRGGTQQPDDGDNEPLTRGDLNALFQGFIESTRSQRTPGPPSTAPAAMAPPPPHPFRAPAPSPSPSPFCPPALSQSQRALAPSPSPHPQIWQQPPVWQQPVPAPVSSNQLGYGLPASVSQLPQHWDGPPPSNQQQGGGWVMAPPPVPSQRAPQHFHGGYQDQGRHVDNQGRLESGHLHSGQHSGHIQHLYGGHQNQGGHVHSGHQHQVQHVQQQSQQEGQQLHWQEPYQRPPR